MKVLPVYLIISLLFIMTPLAFGEEINIPITFQELSGVSGGTWTTTITDEGFTWIYLAGITNNNSFDISNITHEMHIYNNGTEFCTRSGSVGTITAGGSFDLEWYCVVPGIADEAIGSLLNYDIVTVQEETTPTNNYILDSGKSITSTVQVNFMGTDSLFTLVGANFTSGKILAIDIINPNSTAFPTVNTTVSNDGDFNIPITITVNDLTNGNYTVLISSNTNQIDLILNWDGVDMVINSGTESVIEESSSSSNDNSSNDNSSSNNSSSDNSSSNSTTTDWDQYILDLDVTDRLDLIKAVFSYMFS